MSKPSQSTAVHVQIGINITPLTQTLNLRSNEVGFGFALKISFELRLGSLGGLILFYMLKNCL